MMLPNYITINSIPIKIRPPYLHNVVERKRCFHIINSALSKPILWVSAPAGAGKTTLVASYINHMSIPAIWYNIDERDTDFTYFTANMQKALKVLNLDNNIVSPDFTSSMNRQDINIFSMMYFEQLFESLNPPCVLVFDDCHNIPEPSMLYDFFIKGLSQLSEGFYVVFISRDEPPPSLARFQVQRKISMIDFDDIKFDLKETTELITNCVERPVPEEMIDRLYNETGGWIAGIILGLVCINRKENTNIDDAKKAVFNYFLTEVYEPLPDKDKDFLLKTAFFPEFTVEMATKITSHEQVERILTSKYKQYFITKKYSVDDIFTYHGMFRDFLLKQSELYYGQRLNAIVLQAAVILYEHGYIESSVTLIIKFEKWEAFEQLILNHADDLIDEGINVTVGKCLSEIPYNVVYGYPRLLFWKGLINIYLNPAGSRRILDSAYIAFKNLGCREGQLAALCGIVKTILLEGNDFHQLDYWINEFEASLFDVYKQCKNESERENAVSGIVAALIFRQPGHIGIDYWLNEAEKIVLYSKNAETRIFTACSIILYYLWTGAIFKAGVIVDILSLPVRNIDTYPMMRLMYLMAEALYYYYKHAPGEIVKIVDEGLKLAEQTGFHLMDTAFSGLSVCISLIEGNNKAAGDKLREIKVFMERNQSYSWYYYQLISLVEVSIGNFTAAIECGRKSLEMVQKTGGIFLIGINKYLLAYVLVEAGRYDEAIGQLNDIGKLEAMTKSGLFNYHVSTVKTLIALKTNDTKQFEDMFKKCVQFAELSGMRTFLTLRKSVASVCEAALDRGIQVEYVNELISLYNITTDNHLIESFPWPLKIYTLGRFEIFQEGNVIKLFGKPKKMQMELLKALISIDGSRLSSEEIADHLWLDSDGDLAQNALRTGVHRLRKLLGGSNLILTSNGRIWLNPELCWIDVWGVDKIARKIDEGSPPAEMMRLFLNMIGLCKGDFMQGELPDAWVSNRQGKLMNKVSNACLRVGAFHEKSDNWEDAIECYLSTLSIIPSEEVLYQRLIKCYQRMGQSCKALAVYDMYREQLMCAHPSTMAKSKHAALLTKIDSIP
ncbi:MAG: winged helix-turn-helix domain-containing protein [Nitrospirae bacterium]|nr:winged helix-turn-helix domain-containing protein [Nitrospirota bacterium]